MSSNNMVPPRCKLDQCRDGSCAINIDGTPIGTQGTIYAFFEHPYAPYGWVGTSNDALTRCVRAQPWGGPQCAPPK